MARAVTFRCSHDCKLGVLSKDDYNISVGKVQKKHFERLLDFIKSCPGFMNLAKSTVARLLLMWQRRKFYKNQVVFKQGQEIEKLYLVLSGEFQLTQRDEFDRPPDQPVNHEFHQLQKLMSKLKNSQSKAPLGR